VQPSSDLSTDASIPKASLTWRVLGWSLLVVVMAIGFLGYLTPGMRMNWETIAAMCGF